MIVIIGNLYVKGAEPRTASILSRAQNSVYSEQSPEQIIAYADLELYDITNATILEGDITLDNLITNDTVLVTGEVCYECI